jgi:hypothetical protein
MHAMALRGFGQPGGWEWLTSRPSAYGLPDRLPEPMPLPSVTMVLDALRSAGCHGQPWYKVADDAGERTQLSAPIAGDLEQYYLGEVSLDIDGRKPDDAAGPVISSHDLVQGVGFRKPHPVAVLRAVCALAAVGGPMVAFDDHCDTVFVVHPQDTFASLQPRWPW